MATSMLDGIRSAVFGIERTPDELHRRKAWAQILLANSVCPERGIAGREKQLDKVLDALERHAELKKEWLRRFDESAKDCERRYAEKLAAKPHAEPRISTSEEHEDLCAEALVAIWQYEQDTLIRALEAFGGRPAEKMANGLVGLQRSKPMTGPQTRRFRQLESMEKERCAEYRQPFNPGRVMEMMQL